MIMKALKKLKPSKPTLWSVYKLTSKQTYLGLIEAVDERGTIAKAAQQFRMTPMKLMVKQR